MTVVRLGATASFNAGELAALDELTRGLLRGADVRKIARSPTGRGLAAKFRRMAARAEHQRSRREA